MKLDNTTCQFFAHLHRGGSYSYYHTLPERRSHWFPAGQPPALTCGTNWYFGVHPTSAIPPANAHGEIKPPKAVRAQKAYIVALNCLYAEYDTKDYGSKEAILAHLADLPLAYPSVLVDSGGGVHAYWLLREPFVLDTDDRREAARVIQDMWVPIVGGDTSVHDLPRILRIPGTLNYKYDPPRRVNYIICSLDQMFSLRELTAHLPPLCPPVPRPPIAPQHANSIREFNERVDVGSLLVSYGYAWRGTRRMVSPASGSKRDGVAIDSTSNRAFVHTGADPLCDGYWKRPFDIVCILDHNGDFDRALQEIRR